MTQNHLEPQLDQFLKKYAGQVRIAPLAMNIHVLMQSLADEDQDYHQLAEVLHHYPVITARLIALANSAWVCPVTPITNIEMACVRLGSAVVKGVSIAIAVASSFNVARCPAFDPTRFWSTSMLTAEGAGLLAAKLPNRENYPAGLDYTVQTAGILHNLGLLWLADNLSAETAQALELILTDPARTVNDALSECVGIDYCRVGAWIGKEWQIPETLIAVMRHHRDNSYQGQAAILVYLVGAAAKMVSAIYRHEATCPELAWLLPLGVEPAIQTDIYEHLSQRLTTTQQLATQLFY